MDAFHQAQSRYHNRLPDDCYQAGVPFWLRPFEDNLVCPSFDLVADDGFKWLKFSSYLLFCDAILEYGLQYGPNSNYPPVRVLVMGYTPLNDARRLHELILRPNLLPQTFAQAAKNPLEGERDTTQFLQEEGGELGDEREGALVSEAHGVTVNFFITNYNLLWAKSERFCMYTFISDPIEGILAQLALCDQYLPEPEAVLQDSYQEDLLQARHQLLFVMYLQGVNPHNVILSLFPTMHEEVYETCVHCDPDLEEDLKLDPPDTLVRLYNALVNIGLHTYIKKDYNIALHEAYESLMSAEGFVEAYASKLEVIERFNAAKNSFKQEILPLVHRIRQICLTATVIGVPSSLDLSDRLE